MFKKQSQTAKKQKSPSSIQSLRANPVLSMASIAILVALDVIIVRFLGLQQWNMKFSFGFITLAVGGRLYGWAGGAAVGALGDFIGAIAFPTGIYFPGYTLTAAIKGSIYGLCYKRSTGILSVLISVISTQFICTLCLNTLWISYQYGSNFIDLFVTRLLQSGIMTIIEIVITYPLLKITDRIPLAKIRRA